MKKGLFFAVDLWIIVLLLGTGTNAVKESARDEYCGADVTWTLSGGKLTIKGTGRMYDYHTDPPWSEHWNEISEVVIEEGVTTIGDYAFYKCVLTTVSLPSSLYSIGNCSFDWCEHLLEVTIPENVSFVGSDAFYGCSSLTKVVLPNTLTYLADDLFDGCTSLREVIIPVNLTVIGQRTFHDCISLPGFNFPASVTSIGFQCFYNCSSLTHVVVPANVVSITGAPFPACTNLVSIDVEEGNMHFKSKDGILFNNEYNTIIQYPAGKQVTSYIIPENVNMIGEGAFAGCENLVSVTVPSSVTSVADGAFYQCSNLVKVSLPTTITSINAYTFCECTGLTSFVVPSGVVSIGPNAFAACTSLASVVIPSSVRSIEIGCFAGCSSLSQVVLSNGVQSIGSGAFSSCSGLTAITLPPSVRSIDIGAFSSCSSLSNVIMMNGLETIGSGAFSGCTKLSSVTLPSSLSTIYSGAFSGCSSLSAVFYQGSDDSFSYLFGAFDGGVEIVCVSPFYHSSQFCRLDVSYDNDLCKTFQGLFNDCSIPAYENGGFIEQKWENTTQWESHSNGCVKYACIKDVGFVSWSICNSSDEQSRLCIKNQCVDEDKSSTKMKPHVDIEMEEGVKVTDANITELLETISSLCKISSDEIEIGYELDGDGYILRIVVYVNNNEMANLVANAVDSLEKGEDCEAGILCRRKAIRIFLINDESLSRAFRVDGVIVMMTNVLLILLFITNVMKM